MNGRRARKIGVLLINLGTPDAADFLSVRRYLKEFLSDRRVIEMPLWKWWPILNLIILNIRPQKSATLYRRIWDARENDSPLRVFTRRQAKKLTQLLHGDNIIVDYAMRYGNPSIEQRLTVLKNQGCERILMMPLYPQYSSSTTGTANQKVFDVLAKMRWQPAIRTLAPYFDHGAYISALAQHVRVEFSKLSFEPERLILSYHGMPQSYVDKGDPYFSHCQMTSALLKKELAGGMIKLLLVFKAVLAARCG